MVEWTKEIVDIDLLTYEPEPDETWLKKVSEMNVYELSREYSKLSLLKNQLDAYIESYLLAKKAEYMGTTKSKKRGWCGKTGWSAKDAEVLAKISLIRGDPGEKPGSWEGKVPETIKRMVYLNEILKMRKRIIFVMFSKNSNEKMEDF